MRHHPFQNSNQHMAAKCFAIPTDIIVSVFAILLQSDMPYEVHSADEETGLLQLKLYPEPSRRMHTLAMDNLKGMLADYRHFRFGSPDDEYEEA